MAIIEPRVMALISFTISSGAKSVGKGSFRLLKNFLILSVFVMTHESDIVECA